jgi:hypothetical protein
VALYGLRTGSVALSAAATKSMWLLNPTTEYFLVAQMSVSFDSAAAALGIGVELYRTTTLGSPAGTAGTLIKVNRVGDTGAASSTLPLTALSAEPSAVEVLAEWFLQPFGGAIDLQFPFMREPLAAAAGQRIGLRCVTQAGVTANARSYVWFDER